MTPKNVVRASWTPAEFVGVCRNCKKTANAHLDGACLFESATWDPMTRAEWADWHWSVEWDALEGTKFIREVLMEHLSDGSLFIQKVRDQQKLPEEP